ncbi:MAG TPA: hypothetical protein VK875_06075 [Euzebyales bacterium]|nr:hypothetical protein [Euzebyales bacterium]
MKILQPTGKKQKTLIMLRGCIASRCNNPTSSFYCDECWNEVEQPAKHEPDRRHHPRSPTA